MSKKDKEELIKRIKEITEKHETLLSEKLQELENSGNAYAYCFGSLQMEISHLKQEIASGKF